MVHPALNDIRIKPFYGLDTPQNLKPKGELEPEFQRKNGDAQFSDDFTQIALAAKANDQRLKSVSVQS